MAYRDGSTRKGKLLCVHTTFLLCTPQTLLGFAVTEDTLLARFWPKYKYKFDDSRRVTDEKRSSHADSSGRKSLKKINEQFTSSTSCSTFRSVFSDNGNHESVVETHLPSSSHDQYSDHLRAVGWKLTEFTAARPSPRSATGTTGGAAISARSHLRIDSSLDVLSCTQTVEDHEPIDFAAAIVHGCQSRILWVACYLTDSQGASALNLTKLARLGALVHTMNLPCVIVGDFNLTPHELIATQWTNYVVRLSPHTKPRPHAQMEDA